MNFSEYQCHRALATRKIYYMVGAPTFRNLKIMIRNNIIHNLPVTVEDIDIAEIIFGPDVYTLKGTKMRQRPKLVVEDFIEIPKELI